MTPIRRHRLFVLVASLPLLNCAVPAVRSAGPAALLIDNQEFAGYADAARAWHFIFSPKQSKTWRYRIKSNLLALDSRTGSFTSVDPTPAEADRPSAHYPRWWTDNPDPALSGGGHQGALTVSRWRRDFLGDFARRMERCKFPKTSEGAP